MLMGAPGGTPPLQTRKRTTVRKAVDTVDCVDKVAVQVLACQHVPIPKIWWIENEPGKPPHFVFEGFPREGQCILSNQTAIVVCRAAVCVFVALRVGKKLQAEATALNDRLSGTLERLRSERQ